MRMHASKTAIATTIGVLGSTVSALFGGWSKDMETLVLLMAADYLMGLLLAGYFKRSNKSETGALNSYAGWKGLCKKGAALLVVLLAHRLDLSMGYDFIRTATIIGFSANEALSIIENAGLMGVPLPAALVQAVEVLKPQPGKSKEDRQ